jgi:ubiquinone/menaquinone biosynthesis C-methylase UbiE
VHAVAGASRVLDVGCGGGRLTVALARAGAAVTGADTSLERLEQARRRAGEAGVELELVEADFDVPLPFPDEAFDGVTSRLALMAARDPVATLRELRRVLEPGGRIATAVWGPIADNPWFGVPRDAVSAALGAEQAAFARAFGRLGAPGEAAAIHREAGLRDVETRTVIAFAEPASAAEHWSELSRDNGHFRRVEAALRVEERRALLAELEKRFAPYREQGRLRLARTLELVTGRR